MPSTGLIGTFAQYSMKVVDILNLPISRSFEPWTVSGSVRL